jgi:hypothetical protein
LILFSELSFLRAQDLTKDVYVISSYRPEIADADKLGFMPLIPDTFSMGTSINYSVLPSRLKSDFTLRPIKPAKMVGTPLDKLYNSRLKLGIGNYLTPLIEYNIQNLRSKEYTIGAYALHKSSHTEFDLTDNVRVPAGYGRTELKAYGKRFYNDLNLFAEVGAGNHKIRHYGLNTQILADTFDVERSDIKQSFFNLYGNAGIQSTKPDSNSLSYSLMLTGSYFWDHFKNKEPHFNITGTLKHHIRNFEVGLESAYDQRNFKSPVDSADQSIVSFYPFVRKKKNDWQINLGLHIIVLNSSEYDSVYIYPDASIRIRAIDDALFGFFGINGYLEQNSYQNITNLNPYIIPGLHPKNTNHAYCIFTGIEGYLSSKASYRIDVSFEAMEDVIFFLNSDSTPLQNQFEIITDDADIIKYHGEFNWEPLSYLSFFLKSNYYIYKLYAEAKPWHRPAFELLFTTRFNFKQKVYADLDFITIGKRYARDLNTNQTIELDPVFDLNLRLEYKYSNVLSIFLQFYNLTTQQYYLWNQYPVQRLNVLAGISYKF